MQPESLPGQDPIGHSLFPNVATLDQWKQRQVVIRAASLILATVGLAMSAALTFSPTTLTMPSLVLGLTTACILWNSFELYVSHFKEEGDSKQERRKTRMAVETALWVCGLAATSVQTAYVIGGEETPEQLEEENKIWWAISMIVCAILAILSALHITLFVRACIEYNARKKKALVDQLVQELSRRNMETQEQAVSPVSPASYKEYPRDLEQRSANWDKPVELSAMNVYELDASPPCPKELA